MNKKEKFYAEVRLEVLEILEKEPTISTSELSRRSGLSIKTARKYRKDLDMKLNQFVENPTKGIFTRILGSLGN
jgi:predicted transcriptional regulator